MDKVQVDFQNPNALFSPDQWSNKFSLFNDAALPWPPTYAGVPTDAMGNPIQSFLDWQKANPTPGTTLNSTPAQPQQPTSFNEQFIHATDPSGMPYGQTSLGRGVTGYNWQWPQPRQAAAQPAAQPAAPAAPNNWQAALAALANPGKVTTPGATVPQGPSAQPGPANLQSFLQNWRPATSGPGSQFQQNFATALRGMGY